MYTIVTYTKYRLLCYR